MYGRGFRRSALVASTVVLLAAGGAGVARADEGITVETNATYTLDPDAGVIDVELELVLTNVTGPTRSGNVITSYYFNAYGVYLPEEAVDIAATYAGRDLHIEVGQADLDGHLYQDVDIRLARNLDYGATQRIVVSFRLPGGEPRSSTYVRANEAFAHFYALAWGDDDKATVRIVIPPDFEVTREGDRLARTVEDGNQIFYAEHIASPYDWFAVISAVREEAYTTLTLGDDDRIVEVRGWPNDPTWLDEVSETLDSSLDVLIDLVDLDWPIEDTLVITEEYTPTLYGYAGWYLPSDQSISIGEEVFRHVILHEVTHTWFNQDLFDSRWINEGLANTYAVAALDTVGNYPDRPEPIDQDNFYAFDLNRWAAPSVIETDQDAATEDFGYNASWRIVHLISEEIGLDAMSDVVRGARDDLIAYRGAPAPETVATRDDWRRFLDLLQEVGGSELAEQLFIDHVGAPSHDGLIRRRAEARAEIRDLRAAVGDWALPFTVRGPMGLWDFDAAQAAMDEVRGFVELRDELTATASALGLTPAPSLRESFENAVDDLTAPITLARSQEASLADVIAAQVRHDSDRDWFTRIGLIGADMPPDVPLQAARLAWESDDLAEAGRQAATVASVLDLARETGRDRVAIAGASLLVLAVAAVGLIVRHRRRRRPVEPGESVAS